MADLVTVVDEAGTIVNLVVSTPETVVVTDNTRTGPQGAQGVQGSFGAQGAQGAQGLKGDTSAYIFDGGSPSSNYSNGPAFDCGGVV